MAYSNGELFASSAGTTENQHHTLQHYLTKTVPPHIKPWPTCHSWLWFRIFYMPNMTPHVYKWLVKNVER